MKYLYFPLLFALALVLQSAVVPVVLPHWFVAGLDLPLIVTVHVAITRGKIPGMTGGLVLGYLQDAMSGGVLGFNGISKIVAGYTGGFLKEKFFVRSTAHRTAAVAGAALFALLAKAVVYALFGQPGPSPFSALFFWGVAGNTLFTLLAHALLDRFEAAFGIRPEEELSLGD